MALPPLPDILYLHRVMLRRMDTANRYPSLRRSAHRTLDDWWNACEICLAAYKIDKDNNGPQPRIRR